jgi:hypothetical protein
MLDLAWRSGLALTIAASFAVALGQPNSESGFSDAPSQMTQVKPAFDGSGWLADLAQLRQAVETKYGNLEWLTNDRQVSLSSLFDTVASSLQRTNSDIEAKAILTVSQEEWPMLISSSLGQADLSRFLARLPPQQIQRWNFARIWDLMRYNCALASRSTWGGSVSSMQAD